MAYKQILMLSILIVVYDKNYPADQILIVL